MLLPIVIYFRVQRRGALPMFLARSTSTASTVMRKIVMISKQQVAVLEYHCAGLSDSFPLCVVCTVHGALLVPNLVFKEEED